MKEKLPKVFANTLNKKINNNERMYHLNINSKLEDKSNNIKKNISDKIKEIFNSSKYVYKVDVELTLKDKTVIKKIIGKNKNNLITIDNELIPISDIIDIKLK